MLGAVGVQFDRADLEALGVVALVEVARRNPAGGAAATGLLQRTLDDLASEVVAVVLGEAGQHAVHEPSGWCLVDVLRCRDERGTGALDLEQHVGVVAPVASEAIDLVQDHVVNVALLADTVQHVLQLGSAIGLG